ncbi:MAG: cell wall hydrolase [Sphingomicrobium sp.]
MIKFLGSRGAAAVMGLFMLGVGSSASAQDYGALNVEAAVRALDVNTAATPFGKADYALAKPAVAATTAVATLARPAVAATAAVATLARPAVLATAAVSAISGAVLQAQPARPVTLSLTQSVATEAAWLYRGGWQLAALVDRYSSGAQLDEQGNCLATAVYFEARGESVQGQLAVARVVMNRSVSGRYPPDWCGVVKQHAQFSFVQHGAFPWIDTGSAAWARAQGVARLAIANVVPTVANDVLWYHASYVAPSWRHRLNIVEKIGAHIFYRA